MTSSVRWRYFPDAEAVAEETVRWVLASARRAITQRGRFRVVLAGGSTPKQAYKQLAASDADWSRWHLYLGDERCAPAGDKQRNSRMIKKTLVKRSRIPKQQVLPR